MMRLPRFFPSLASFAIACSLALPALTPRPARAQEEAPAAPAATAASATSSAQAAAPSPELITAVDDYWHYAKIARYPLAAEAGQKVLDMKAAPVAVLAAFEKTAEQHKDNLEQWMLRWQGVDELRDVTAQLLNVLSQGQFARRADTKFIENNIQRLITTDRGFAIGVDNLRKSGELAYPMMIDYLRDPSKTEYQLPIRNAMVALGRVGLNPLTAATEIKDAAPLTMIVTVLGDLGYDAAVPYLARLAQDAKAPAAARTAAQQALKRMGAGTDLNPADLFYNLAEKFYYGNASISADPRNPAAYVWYWDDTKGLTSRPVPPVIFNDVMAMRTARSSLELNSSKGEAASLWLAANYKREADLPAEAKDPTAPPNSAHFYGVSAGTRYLNDVVRRALNDRNASVALRSIKSLEQIAGQSNLFSGGQPILDALQYPDRQVRFESAFALASALPQERFQTAERVVPVLAEALSQTGKPNVLVVAPAGETQGPARFAQGRRLRR